MKISKKEFKKMVVEYEKNLHEMGVNLHDPIDWLKGQCKIKLDDFSQQHVRCWDIWEEPFFGNHMTLSQWILRKTKLPCILSNTQSQDLHVLQENSRPMACPVCNGVHTANDIEFSSDQKCMGVKIKPCVTLYGGDAFIQVMPGQEYTIKIVVGDTMKVKTIRT